MKKMFALPLGMLLLCMMMIGNAFADKPKNQQILPPADATQADSTATADFQEMPVLDLRSPIDFMNDETAGASSIAVDPPGAVLNVVSVPNFSGSFVFNGTTFPFTIMGNDPSQGHKTNIPAKIVSVDVQLLNADGTVFANVPVAPFENLTLNSPNFRRAHYTVGNVQFGDAVQRAEFFNHMKDNWHTNLSPVKIVEHVTVPVPFTVTVRIRGVNTPVRTWFTRTSTDGNTVVFMLQQFFNAQFSNISVNAINAGDWTTDAMNVQLWPNTFLFTPSATPLVTRGPCCVLGFHTLFRDPTVTPQPRWIVAYASWISPGTFTNTEVIDVTPISHEILESFNDPFLNNATPRWQFPVGTSCQRNLETGDPVEVLPHPSFPVTLKIRQPGDDGGDADDDGGDDGDGGQRFTFHPQTEALIQWFTQTSPSDAFRGAFSYPDITALPTPAKPCP
ncbi:MAG: hypothetical protein DMG65_17285 [Candidatus Angelobacter sp. Gp1-AA117]|nr:MAG: hypothetical protein DMG65_17285 [Candidatus Angelobacter sp. Gp1-AA117]